MHTVVVFIDRIVSTKAIRCKRFAWITGNTSRAIDYVVSELHALQDTVFLSHASHTQTECSAKQKQPLNIRSHDQIQMLFGSRNINPVRQTIDTLS